MNRTYFASFVVRPVVKGLVEGEYKLDRFAAKHAEFTRDNFVRFGDENLLAISAKSFGKLFSKREREEMLSKDLTSLYFSILYSLVMACFQPNLIQPIQSYLG